MDELDLGSTIRGFTAGQKVFGRYRLVRILGRGGMGVVWLARDEKLDRDVALKFLPEVVALDARAVDDLKRETRRSLELTHPNIVRIYDFVEDARAAAISMEYVSGATLSTLALERPHRNFEPDDLSVWVRQLCEALDYAHGIAEVVHRDLKPANLMVDGRGNLKVADFGIAASVSDSVSRVSAQAGSSGTPVYMSPQQMMGEKPAVSDDIYSLGATLYDLLTGRPPFHAGNIIAQVQGKVPPGLAERRAELAVKGEPIPLVWEETIAACLAKESDRRPQSASAVAERLGLAGFTARHAKSTRDTEVVVAVPAKKVGRADPGAPRSRSRALFFVGLSIAAAVLAFGGWWWGIHQPEQRRQAELRAEQAAALAAEQASERAREEARSQLVHRVAGMEAALARNDWAEVERRLSDMEEAARGVPSAVIPDWTAAELRLRDELAERREAARLAAVRIPVTVRTQPEGAEIWLAGENRGTAPVTNVPLPLGEHEMRIRLAGHEEVTENLMIAEAGQVEWEVDLTRYQGELALRSRPEAARYLIYLDTDEVDISGEPHFQGDLPVAEPIVVPTGRHVLRVERPGHESLTFRRTFTVERGQTVSVDADVRGGEVRITSEPLGAEVWIDGARWGETPWTSSPLPMGQELAVELRRPGFQPVQRTLAVATYDEPLTWEAVLPLQGILPDLTRGPDRVQVTMAAKTRTTMRTTTSGRAASPTTTDDDTRLVVNYSLSEPDGLGLWQQARGEVEEATYFHPGTLMVSSRRGADWESRFERGGYSFSGGENIAPSATPLYPALWLDPGILPAGPPELGQSWVVPLEKARLLLVDMRLLEPTGTIRGSITRLGGQGDGLWAEVEFKYDLRGGVQSPFGTDVMEGMTGHYVGTLNFRVLMFEAYVSEARVVQQGTITSRTDSGRRRTAEFEVQVITEITVDYTVEPL